MNRKRKLLMIEDERDIARIVQDYLHVNGFEVVIAESGKDGIRLINKVQPDLIILDLTLPDMDGIELCRQIRDENEAPILILSARSSDTDKVLGLGFGADDYMTKPFSFSELVARIHAHIRRNERTEQQKINKHVLKFNHIVIDKQAYTLTVGGKEISLSAKEFDLLYFLADHKNQVFSKSQLLDAVWGFAEYGDENTVTVYIRRLREKFEIDPSNPTYIKTVWGIGYKFSLESE